MLTALPSPVSVSFCLFGTDKYSPIKLLSDHTNQTFKFTLSHTGFWGFGVLGFWELGLGIGIGDWDFGLGLGIGQWD